jgi:hypothetical protein
MSKQSWTVLAAVVGVLFTASPALAVPGTPTSLGVADLVSDAAVFDPQFTWAPVTGAKGYQVEVNSDVAWASGSKVCCDDISSSVKMTTYGTSFSPPVVLPNNTYYWRVRAVDASGVAGLWASGPTFEKSFGDDPSITNLRLVDTDFQELAPGSVVAAPVILWDNASGASSYQVGVAPFDGSVCDWSAPPSVRWDKVTASTGWTPLGWNRGLDADPLSSGSLSPSDDIITALVEDGQYCVRVRPIDRASSINGPEIVSTWTYLPANNEPAFQWAGPPAVAPCSPCGLAAGDYLRPVSGSTVGTMPVFTWSPVPGAQSYFVVVAKDAAFTNIVDYAYTRVTAYAPRKNSQTTGYPDETTNYYWAVLPASQPNGDGVSEDPVSSNPQPFKKQATPPTLFGPIGGVTLSTAATVFHWTPVIDARRYRLQVSEDSSFANVIQEQSALVTGAATDSTAYTSSTAYPTGVTLYWRVQAEAENGSGYVGLRWSATGTFKRSATSGSSGGGADKRFLLSAKGYPVRRAWRDVTITVKNLATNAPVANAYVRVSGAGVTAKTKRTGSLGKVTFHIKATKYPGTVTYKVSKSGFKTAYLTQSVRFA